MLKLRDIMTRDVISVAPELPLDELVELFTARHIGGAPVVSGHKVVGVISATDLLSFALKSAGRPTKAEPAETWENEEGLSELEEEELPEGYFRGAWDASGESFDSSWEEVTADGKDTLFEYRVADVMSNDVLWLPPETDVIGAAEFMKSAGIHRLLVMKEGALEGIVSSMDIVNAVAREQLPAPKIVLNREADFDSGWTHEPVIPEREP
jgi:CBS domain-containing protein